MPCKLTNLLKMLKGAADPTRLRILAALGQGDLTVGEMTAILLQSQPRVSRHLKLLGTAGLLDRYKEQHNVYYRVRPESEQVIPLAGALDPKDPVLQQDAARRATVIADRLRRATDRLAEQAAATDDEGDTTGPTVGGLLLDELKGEPVGAVLDVGTGAGHLLRTLAPLATRAVGVDISGDALRLARTFLHGAGFTRSVLRQGDMYKLPFGADEFDTLTMGRLLSHAKTPEAALREAHRVLRPGGRLVLVEDFDDLDAATTTNPLSLVRAWLRTTGFHCDRLRPIDTGVSHLLVTIARRPVRMEEVA